MNKGRVIDLADIVKNNRLPCVSLDMSVWAAELNCGTTACLAGYTVIAAYGSAYKLYSVRPNSSIFKEAKRILDLTEFQANRLFACDIGVGKEQAVRTLRHLAETGEVDWKA